MLKQKQEKSLIYHSIKFPFTYNNNDERFIDLNETLIDKTASEILHVLLTPVRTRLRMPDFGSNLIRYIFSPNDDVTFDNVKAEAIRNVTKYVKNVEIDDIRIIKDEENEHNIMLYVKYIAKQNGIIENNEIGVIL